METILIQSVNTRIIQQEDRKLAVQELKYGQWVNKSQNGNPAIFSCNHAGLEECEKLAGVWVSLTLNPALANELRYQ